MVPVHKKAKTRRGCLEENIEEIETVVLVDDEDDGIEIIEPFLA